MAIYVEFPERRFKVWWRYLGPTRHDGVNYGRGVHCSIGVEQTVTVDDKLVKEYLTVAEAVSRCNPKDRFTKEIGRKRSLANALKRLDANIVVRKKLFWNAYFNRPRTAIWNEFKVENERT